MSDNPVNYRSIPANTAEQQTGLDILLQTFDQSPELITISDWDTGLYWDVNQTFIDTMGYSREEMVGQHIAKISIWTSLDEQVQAIADLAVQNGRVRKREIKYITRSGEIGTGWWSAELIKSKDKVWLVSRLLDITAKKQTEETLQKSEHLFRLLAENARDVIYFISMHPRKVEYISPSIQTITGYTPEDHYQNPWLIFDTVHPEDRGELTKPAAMYNEDPTVIRWISREGKIIWTEQRNKLIYDDKQQVIALEGIARDITERMLMEERLKHTSLHDALTYLYNRAYFEEEMRRLDNSRQNSGIAIVACDVDGLKLVNDVMGHTEGDSIIRAAASVLEASFRQGDVVARVGGDEFAVIVSPASRAIAQELVNRVKQGVQDYNGQIPGIPLGLSVGYALRTSTQRSMADIYRDADSEMYKNKMHNRKQYRQHLLRSMAEYAEKDVYPEGLPIERMKQVITILGKEMKVSRKRMEFFMRLAEFHDIGLVSVPRGILIKSSSLTAGDWQQLKQHTDNGYRIANTVPELSLLADGIFSHHECWDGSGYPRGLKGNKIPLESRIISIADAFAAMTCPRVYREAITDEAALAEIQKGAGTQFDPDLVAKLAVGWDQQENKQGLQISTSIP